MLEDRLSAKLPDGRVVSRVPVGHEDLRMVERRRRDADPFVRQRLD
jgi:hypothetical protein